MWNWRWRNIAQFPAAQVVPTLYTDVRNNTISTNQYSVTEYFKVPAAIF